MVRNWYFAFEGDDSFLKLELGMLKHRQKIVDYWSSWGFNMKLKFIVNSAEDEEQIEGCVPDLGEFCGWKYFIRNGEVTRINCPDIGRRMINSALTTSDLANQTLNGRNQVGAASNAANSEAFEKCVPGLSDKFAARGWEFEKQVKKWVKLDTKS